MKKIFLILIPILLLIGIIVCIFVMQPKEVSTIPENTTIKVGESDEKNTLTDNVETSNDVTKSNSETENIINETTSENKETEKNTLTNTTSNNQTKTEDKNKTTTKTQTSAKSNNTNKDSSTNSNKTTTTSKKPATNTTNSSTNKTNTTTVNSTSNNGNKTNTTLTTKKEETHKHFMPVNAGWFKTVDELEAEVDREFDKWDKKYYAGEITWDELGKYCPIRIRIL